MGVSLRAQWCGGSSSCSLWHGMRRSRRDAEARRIRGLDGHFVWPRSSECSLIQRNARSFQCPRCRRGSVRRPTRDRWVVQSLGGALRDALSASLRLCVRIRPGALSPFPMPSRSTAFGAWSAPPPECHADTLCTTYSPRLCAFACPVALRATACPLSQLCGSSFGHGPPSCPQLPPFGGHGGVDFRPDRHVTCGSPEGWMIVGIPRSGIMSPAHRRACRRR